MHYCSCFLHPGLLNNLILGKRLLDGFSVEFNKLFLKSSEEGVAVGNLVFLPAASKGCLGAVVNAEAISRITLFQATEYC